MNLTGQTFNFWRVIRPTKNRAYYYDCECLKCGKIYSVYQNTLKNGKGKMCRACAGKEQSERQRIVHDEIMGKKFGRLTVIGWEKGKNNRTVYICKCECGNQTTAIYSDLVSGKKSSCSCLRSDMSSKSIKDTYKPMQNKQEKAQIDGTIAYTLESKTPKNNVTGVKGVSKMKNSKYRAYINFARKQIYLGSFDTLAEAAAARKEAEEKYYKPILDRYKKDHS